MSRDLGRPSWHGSWHKRLAKTDPRAPFERIAAQLREDVLSGRLPAGQPAPTLKQLADEHRVSEATAHRAMTLLKTWGLIAANPGYPIVVLAPPARAIESEVIAELRSPVTSRVCRPGAPPLDRPDPSALPNGPVSAVFTDQKSSATSSVLVAPWHRWKD